MVWIVGTGTQDGAQTGCAARQQPSPGEEDPFEDAEQPPSSDEIAEQSGPGTGSKPRRKRCSLQVVTIDHSGVRGSFRPTCIESITDGMQPNGW
jgi:hypothetical protein